MAVECESLIFKLENDKHLRLTLDEAYEMYTVLKSLLKDRETSYPITFPNYPPGVREDNHHLDIFKPTCEEDKNSFKGVITDTGSDKVTAKWNSDMPNVVDASRGQPTIPPVGKYERRKKDKCAC